MRRIPIQLEEEMYEALKTRAYREGRSIADLVRESIAMNRRNVPQRSIEEFSFVGSGSSAADRKDRPSENHDRALAAAFAPARKRKK